MNGIAPQDTDCRLDDLDNREDNETVAALGVVADEKTVYTGAGNVVVFAKLRDDDTCIEVLIFGGAMARAGLL